MAPLTGGCLAAHQAFFWLEWGFWRSYSGLCLEYPDEKRVRFSWSCTGTNPAAALYLKLNEGPRIRHKPIPHIRKEKRR